MLVRHGETAWNVGEIFRGRIDVDLNETGRKQAGLLSQYLNELRYRGYLLQSAKTGIRDR